MLSEIVATSQSGYSITFRFGNVGQNYIVSRVDGLNPVKSTIIASEFGQLDGTMYRSSYRIPRDIKLYFDLEPVDFDKEPADLRDDLYAVFLPKQEVTLQFNDSRGRRLFIKGVVETFETEIFTQEPRAEVSIYCADPDFKAINKQQPNEFLAHKGLTAHNNGNITSPCNLSVLFTDGNDGFAINGSQGLTQAFRLELDYKFLIGDQLLISSEPGNKYINLVRSGTTTSILYTMRSQSTWPVMYPRSNKIAITNAVNTLVSIDWVPRYGGL